MIVADGSHQTAAQRGGEAKDKDKPLPDLQRGPVRGLSQACTLPLHSLHSLSQQSPICW